MTRKNQVTPDIFLKNYINLFQLQDFPLIKQFCLDLKEEFKVICFRKYDNILQQISELLEIDAQLQMFLDVFKYDFFRELNLTEEQIIEMIQHDKNMYYRQLVGLGINQNAPTGLIFLSEND